jgi:hypothetical protein
VAQAGDPVAGPLGVHERAQLTLVLTGLRRGGEGQDRQCQEHPTHGRQDLPRR